MPEASVQNGSLRTPPREDPGPAPPQEPASDEIELAPRLRLVETLIQEAFDVPSPVAANLQASGGDLLEMTLLLKPQLVALLQSCTSPEEVRELQPFLDTYLKLNRQADRLLRLGQEIAQADSGHTQRQRSKTTAKANISDFVTHAEGSGVVRPN